MATFWAVYVVVMIGMPWEVDWREIRWTFHEVFRSVLIRGGVAVAGLHGICIVVDAYLSR